MREGGREEAAKRGRQGLLDSLRCTLCLGVDQLEQFRRSRGLLGSFGLTSLYEYTERDVLMQPHVLVVACVFVCIPVYIHLMYVHVTYVYI